MDRVKRTLAFPYGGLFVFLFATLHSYSFSQSSGWERLNSGTNSPFYGVAFADSSTGIAVGGVGAIFRTTDGGNTWSQRASGANQRLTQALVVNDSSWFFAGLVGTIVFSSDKGMTWQARPSGTIVNLTAISFADSIGIAVGGDPAGNFPTVVRSTDTGRTWNNVTVSAPWGFRAATMVDTRLAFAAGIAGTLMRSTNGGVGWTNLSVGGNYNLLGISFWDSLRGVIVGSSGRIMRTSNGGVSWSQEFISPPANFWDVTCLSGGIAIAVGTSGIIVRSTDYGQTWNTQTSGTTGLIASVAFPTSFTGFAVADSGVILRTRTGGIPLDVHDARYQAVRAYSLEQNYPNPFNPITNIRYQVSEVSHVTLKVYDLLGRDVATLVNERMNLGTYSASWNAVGFASGVYLYRLQAGSFSQVKKLILLR